MRREEEEEGGRGEDAEHSLHKSWQDSQEQRMSLCGSSGGWGWVPSKVHLESFRRTKYSNHREILVLVLCVCTLCRWFKEVGSVLEESKGKAGLNCIQLAPLWLCGGFPCLFHHWCVAVPYPDTLRWRRSQSGARTPVGKVWSKRYGTDCALTPKSIFFSPLHKYCISVEKYIISIIKCSLVLRSGFLYKLLGVFHDSGKAAVSGFAGVFSTCCRAGLEWTVVVAFEAKVFIYINSI